MELLPGILLLAVVVRSVKRDADEEHHDGEEKDSGEKLHGHSLPIRSMRRSICRCTRKMPAPRTTAPNAPINQSVGFALTGVEISQPTKAISVATMIPSQN